jgi:hypothetical protein
MDGYVGAVILATNFRQNMDDAFLRRLDVVVDFPFPEAKDRERIWRLVLPDAAPLADDVDVPEGWLPEDVSCVATVARHLEITTQRQSRCGIGAARRFGRLGYGCGLDVHGWWCSSTATDRGQRRRGACAFRHPTFSRNGNDRAEP